MDEKIKKMVELLKKAKQHGATCFVIDPVNEALALLSELEQPKPSELSDKAHKLLEYIANIGMGLENKEFKRIHFIEHFNICFAEMSHIVIEIDALIHISDNQKFHIDVLEAELKTFKDFHQWVLDNEAARMLDGYDGDIAWRDAVMIKAREIAEGEKHDSEDKKGE